MTSPASAPIMVKTENAVAARLDQRLMKPRVSDIVSDRNTAAIGSFATANGDALALGFAFAQANARERRVGEHAVRDEPITLGASPAAQMAR